MNQSVLRTIVAGGDRGLEGDRAAAAGDREPGSQRVRRLAMTNPRLVLAVSLAAGALAVLMDTIAVGGALRAGLAPWPGIAVVAMATAAFVLSGKQESFLVAGLLAASGVVSVVYGLLEYMHERPVTRPILAA